jgi:hypothetical protein
LSTILLTKNFFSAIELKTRNITSFAAQLESGLFIHLVGDLGKFKHQLKLEVVEKGGDILMTAYKDAVLEESSRIISYILKGELSDEEKERVITDSIENFNEHVNPGWLKYRKSVSTDAAFVEWEDSQETFKDTRGKEFIDCLGGFGHRQGRLPNTVSVNDSGGAACGIRQCRSSNRLFVIGYQLFVAKEFRFHQDSQNYLDIIC